MLRFLAVRLLSLIPVLCGISIFTFLLIHIIPGDIVTVIMGLSLSSGPHEAEQIRRALHLNEPLPVQYAQWLWGVLHGDLGKSLILGFPVFPQVMSHLPITLELAAFALVISVLIGIPLGVIAAQKRNLWPDYLLKSVSLLGLSTPDFFLGTVIILLSSLYLPSLHTFGFVPFTQNPWLNLESMFFPAFTLGLVLSAIIMRYTRASVLDVMQEQYVVTARAKGVRRRRVLYRHILRNALIPVVTIAGINGAYLLGGTIVVEQVFSLPGVGQLIVNSIYHRDYTMVQGAVLVITTGVVLLNLIVDLLYFVVDPRIRLEG
jgi:peptide/nickel transport system permease protein